MTASPPFALIRTLVPADLPALQKLRREALRLNPESFANDEANDFIVLAEAAGPWLSGDADQAIFGAWSGSDLVGMAGVYRQHGPRFRHKLQLWGMYVSPAVRGRGVAARLLRAVIAAVSAWPDALMLNLCVNAASTSAHQLYERAGFREWGLEPGGFRHGARLIDDRHMSLVLKPAAGG